MQNTIVTGATGLVGSHVLVHLVKNKCRVIALKRENSNTKLVQQLFDWYGLSNDDYVKYIDWKIADVLDIDSLEELIQHDYDVYHCAAQVSFNPSQKDNLLNTNVQGTANLVNVCLLKKVRKLCYVSSVATLSLNKGETIINENSFWKNTGNESVYAQSKYLAEMEVWRGIEEGLNAVIVNPTVIIGPHDFTKGSAKMIGTSGNGLMFYTNGISGFVDVNDVAKAMIILMNNDVNSERYLLNMDNIPYKTFFEKVSEKINAKPPIIPVNSLLSGLAWRIAKIKSIITNTEPLITKETSYAAMQQNFYDASKFKKQFSYNFIDLNNCLENACNYYLKHKQNDIRTIQ